MKEDGQLLQKWEFSDEYLSILVLELKSVKRVEVRNYILGNSLSCEEFNIRGETGEDVLLFDLSSKLESVEILERGYLFS